VIGSLRGRVIDRGGEGVVLVEVGGIGYQGTMTPNGAARLPSPLNPSAEPAGGQEVFIWVHHHVREDAEVLFGFGTRGERSTFEILVGTHGVGPAMALSILGSLGPDELARAVVTEDAAALCRVPGVGKKTAARLLVELGSKLSLDPSSPGTPAPGPGEAAAPGARPDGVAGEVQSALIGLGYGPDEISQALKGLDPELDSAAALKAALRQVTATRA